MEVNDRLHCIKIAQERIKIDTLKKMYTLFLQHNSLNHNSKIKNEND